MGAKRATYPIIGGTVVSSQPSDQDAQFDALWEKYEPKVRKTASSFCIPGAVGAELEDLVQIGQSVLLHALRTFDSRRGRFSTHYYTLLRNCYLALHRRCYPKNRMMVVAHNNSTGDRKTILCTSGELEGVISELRSTGYTYGVTLKAPKTRYPLLDNVRSLDEPITTGVESGKPTTIGETIADTDGGLTVEQIVNKIAHRIPDPHLRKIAIWLFEGHKVSGSEGIMRRVGIKKHQFERDVRRIRMLLAGEFGVRFAGG